MHFPLFIARRYLFSKKSHNAINIISAISVGGVALATTALLCTLSVFNGFHDLIGSLYTAFDPQLEVAPAKGKFAAADDPALDAVRRDADVASVTECLEDNGLILFKGHPLVVMLKGVADNYAHTTGIDSILYQGERGGKGFRLRAADIAYGTPGIGLAAQFGTIDYGTLQICAPRPGERINMANPAESFNVADLTASGVCFQVHQRKYDDNYLLVPLFFTQSLFEKDGQITALEVRLKDGVDVAAAKERLRTVVGERFTVKDRFEQQEDTFKIMNIEKMMAYLFLTFIVLVACFNIIGSVSMLIIEKRDDARTLRHLGATDGNIVRVFFYEGCIISLLGAVIGVVLGLALCWGQQTFGWLRLGGTTGNFIVDAYPVSVHALDVAAVFVTVVAVGFLSVWYPVRFLSRRLL